MGSFGLDWISSEPNRLISVMLVENDILPLTMYASSVVIVIITRDHWFAYNKAAW